VDTGQMSQVINNLLINATQAMPEGGVIEIRAANMCVGVASYLPLLEGRYVTITVTDAGCGIPAAQLEKIFDPYFTTKPTGSGLGLAVAYAILKKHEGHITVASTVGVGTTFSLYLPASPHPTPTGSEATASPLTGQGKILLMDDEDMIRELTGTLLTQLGYEVASAADGIEALALYASAHAANQPFVAVILDLTIPGGMGGKAVVGQLLDINPQVKAIASSGYSNDPVLANFRQYGFSGVLAKPYTMTELSIILQRVIH
jgi:CheY-like chemotaxis protein